jgi:hypothetical protein
MPISRLKTRLKEPSDSYPTADATSENDALFERIKEPALNIRTRGLEMGDNKSALKIQQSLDDHKANSKKAR